MTPLAVIEYFDVFKYSRLGVLSRVKVLQIDSCGLEGMKEALRDGVVPTVALAAHTGLYAMLHQQLPIAVSPHTGCHGPYA